jgi:hypothetical protein
VEQPGKREKGRRGRREERAQKQAHEQAQKEEWRTEEKVGLTFLKLGRKEFRKEKTKGLQSCAVWKFFRRFGNVEGN